MVVNNRKIIPRESCLLFLIETRRVLRWVLDLLWDGYYSCVPFLSASTRCHWHQQVTPYLPPFRHSGGKWWPPKKRCGVEVLQCPTWTWCRPQNMLCHAHCISTWLMHRGTPTDKLVWEAGRNILASFSRQCSTIKYWSNASLGFKYRVQTFGEYYKCIWATSGKYLIPKIHTPPKKRFMGSKCDSACDTLKIPLFLKNKPQDCKLQSIAHSPQDNWRAHFYFSPQYIPTQRAATGLLPYSCYVSPYVP